ncbi:hypothetical protein CN177_21195 [Sinorhizobium meliloti]|nr:hypothetical protein [Sinorhizobium meliloti]MQV07919.1 hypothetical protein [Sinorhizobium meliloti]MQW28808.1 hypothetical protein [Sinorhizobium meliloti]MQX59154.1 hypothetical protein [Sinorhizobium meliloti]RVE93857.1 hypothetical protein CN238_02170 [Sinorhizobium meliloti]
MEEHAAIRTTPKGRAPCRVRGPSQIAFMRRQITMFLGRVDLLHVSFNRIRLKDKNMQQIKVLQRPLRV